MVVLGQLLGQLPYARILHAEPSSRREDERVTFSEQFVDDLPSVDINCRHGFPFD
jgi:hypothetical protein